MFRRRFTKLLTNRNLKSCIFKVGSIECNERYMFSLCLPFRRSMATRRDHLILPDMKTIWDCTQYKGLAFTIEERQLFGIIGLIPPCYRTMDEQVLGIKSNFDSYVSPLDKYVYLMALRSRNERLFFRFMNQYAEDCLPIVYTPTVGMACVHFGLIYHTPYGIYITKHDKNHIIDVLGNWRRKNVTAICVTDGERILGLGDLGASGMGISVGKLQLYTALGNIPPDGLLPVVVDVGTNNKTLLTDPFYIGLREERLRGQGYDDLFDELMESISELYGSQCLIHFEDFATPNAFKLLEKYQTKYCCFNDDVQGTAATGVAGVLAACRATERDLKDNIILFVGVGSACTGISSLLLEVMVTDGIDKKEAQNNIFLFDVNGLITSNQEDLPNLLKVFAKDMDPVKNLKDVIALVKPNILIGATGAGKIFTEDVLRELAKHHERPVVFALSNPTSQSECTAEEAFRYTDGRVIFSSGSPFPPVIWEGKTYYPGQANNSLIFPGVALGILSSKARHIPDEVFIIAAKAIASSTTDEQLEKGSLYPPLSLANQIAFEIAVKIGYYVFDKGLSAIYPHPDDICSYIYSQLYSYEYGPTIHMPWKYPPSKRIKIPEVPKKQS